MARLIVHIGAPAAGAAPLQIRLARRAEALERAGACWLDASDLAGGRPNLDAMVKLSGRGEAFRARIGLRRALALCKPRAEICLGSSERLWWLDDPALIAGFAEGLRKVYERIDIVACLPRQDRMLVAQRAPAAAPRALTLAARLWGTEPRALPSWRPEFAGRLDHAARLDRWRAAFGADAVHALIDPRDAAEPEAAPTLAATLAGLAGLPAELFGPEPPLRPRRGIRAARALMAMEAREAGLGPRERREIAAAAAAAKSGPSLKPSRAEAAALMARCAPFNARLEADWRGPDGAPLRFADDLSDWPEVGTDRLSPEAGRALRKLLMEMLARMTAEQKAAGLRRARVPRLGPEAGRAAGRTAGEVRKQAEWGELGWRRRVRRRRRLAAAGKL
ncbi:MAG: hypothetical protein CML46_18790 [Rhodobacteraceae bacterium]|nr:hypothetical protein [Paracoccaceae bacterium]MBR28962.1 hypothetical protein [Paracoccaceae bacterium]